RAREGLLGPAPALRQDRPGPAPRLMTASDYAWVEAADQLLSALTITLVQPDDGTALRGLRPKSQYPAPMTFEEALDAAFALPAWAYNEVVAQLDSIGGWTAL